MSDLDRFISDVAKRTDRELRAAMKRLRRDAPARLMDAVEYSLFSGGKRIRPVVACAVCVSCGGRVQDAVPAGAAVELVHTYSLVHDDLPAMDNDDFRRGKPTNHKVFGDAMAILAGDALQTAAFDLLTHDGMARELARQAGAGGMVGGQVLDLDSEKIKRVRDLEAVYLKKTAALFVASAKLGAMSAGASAALLRKAGAFGRHLGLAFQVTDDVLDETQDGSLKAAEPREAASFPNMFGLAEARRYAARCAAACRRSMPCRTPILEAIVDLVVTRTR